MTSPSSVGFVGLGGMGSGLVKNLLAHGVPVSVLDKRAEAMETAVERGARAAQSVSDLASSCDVLMVCVNTASDSEAVILEALDHLGEGDIVVEHTTTNPDSITRLDTAVRATGAAFAEAPMTRTPMHAERGEVNVLYGGSAGLLERLRPLFDCYAENVFHVGPLTHGIKLKLIHNYIAFSNVAAWCEGFALAAKENLDMTQVIDIISAAGGKSGMMDLYGRSTLQRDFEPMMSLANAMKDVGYYVEWLKGAGLPAFMADAVHQTYALAAIMGHAEESCTAVIKAYERLSGVEAHLPEDQEKI
jgi:3-hydroxyisobutyrate dehydrogenase-like beta-hydroxyacid dehydrogenase